MKAQDVLICSKLFDLTYDGFLALVQNDFKVHPLVRFLIDETYIDEFKSVFYYQGLLSAAYCFSAGFNYSDGVFYGFLNDFDTPYNYGTSEHDAFTFGFEFLAQVLSDYELQHWGVTCIPTKDILERRSLWGFSECS